jgi:hypothetical protein
METARLARTATATAAAAGVLAVLALLPQAGCGSSTGPTLPDALVVGLTDGSSSSPDTGETPDMPAVPVKRMFVTATPYGANLAGAAGVDDGELAGDDGLLGGDLLCQRAADGAVLGGRWTAWLSASASASSPGVNAIDRIPNVGPWYNTDGSTMLFRAKANLATSPEGGAWFELQDEFGNSGNSRLVWTGTRSGGTAGETCFDWTTDYPGNRGLFGTTSSPETWTESDIQDCGIGQYSLYCFEQ